MSAPPYPPAPVAPVIDRQQGSGTPVPGKRHQKFLIPAIIVVVIIVALAVVVLVGIPGQPKFGPVSPGTSTPAVAVISRAFEGDWQVESTANSGTAELYRISILPDNTVTVSVPAWPKMQISGSLSDSGSTLKGTFSDGATGESGTFTLVRSDNTHFSGTWLVKGHSYTMTGQKGTRVSQPATYAAGITSVPRTSVTQTTVVPGSSIRAGFNTDKTSGPTPLTVSFSDTSTGSPDKWSWDFGDGTPSTERNPIHSFKTEGSFTVTLVVDKNGQTSSKSIVISASSHPLNANFVADQTSGNAPLTVTFTDTSTGSPTTWIWQFGNGQTSYDRNPEITYQGPGTYTVQLTVEKGGVQSKKSMTIYVNPAPSVSNPVTTAVTSEFNNGNIDTVYNSP
ncbi:MAG: PKD domain-containing protein, partial [Methanomicrobiales archaeon]|nr:PKD domain-containing protein [Methanomicrobiales archaeon]